MPVHPAVRGLWSVALFLLLLGGLAAVVSAQDELPPEIDGDGVQTLTRGPVHEAFASPTVADPKPNIIVPKKPPEDVREQPPEFQPEGLNVQWFPGYWSFDEDREDFIWVSGAWRDPPPGKRWVPGYWAEVPGGYQWVAGFWIDEAVEEIQYLQSPPDSLEQGPSVTSPGDNYQYIPGTWTYINNDYRWQAGYWAPYQEDWVYVPAQWNWTPRGCVFVPGYYDWRVPRRGQIFAPVYFSTVAYRQPTYFYRPRCIINTSNLFVHLWVRPNYCHYYFGNYYGSVYSNRHFTAWCDYRPRPRCYDPLLSYCNVHYGRQGIDYVGRMKGWHNHYDHHEHERPAITYKDQLAQLKKAPQRPNRPGENTSPQARPIRLAEDLKDVVRQPQTNSHWKPLDLAAKNHNQASIEQIKKLHNLRLDQEKLAFIKPDGVKPEASRPGGEPDLKLGGSTRPNRPGRPSTDNPMGEVKTPLVGEPGKFKLPKPALASNRPDTNKPLIKVPETPDKTIVNRPSIGGIDLNRPGINRPEINRPEINRPGVDPSAINRPGVNRPGDEPKLGETKLPGTSDKPTRIPGLRNPGADTVQVNGTTGLPTKRPEIGSKLPSLNGPIVGGQDIGKPDIVKPNDRMPLDPKPSNVKPRPGLDAGSLGGNDAPKKPNLGTSSAAAAAQQRLEALRQQQQDLLNKARNPGGNSGGGNAGGSNPNGLRPNTTRVETPKVEKPKLNLGGGNSLPNQGLPRNLTPGNSPRTPSPTIEPRSFKPNTGGGNVSPRNAQRPATPSVTPRVNPAPRVEPRSNNNNNSNNDKRRGR